MEPVLFYGHREGTYAAFSNFHPASFAMKPKLGLPIQFACSEQALMYGKSKDPEYRKKVLKTTDPFTVKKLGRACTLRPDWDDIKFGWMVEVLTAKFSQNADLKELLLLTGDRPIHEDCPDEHWGGGPNYPRGRDLLGKALMKVRSILRDQETPDT